ncbi:MAG TPA: PAS domain S-box protein [Spirochaetota bacterium]|nr:PAS domain S-box protein [Spirochaetota bacterium]
MEKILVVDHELSSLYEYNNILSSAGYGVITAVDGKNGIEKYNKEKPDLVLMDAMIPGINCYETARLIREEGKSPHLPIIFISDALKDIESGLNALESIAVDFLIKPVEDKALLLKIRASLRMKHLYDELYATRNMLQRSEAKYRTILDTMQDGFFEVDVNGNLTFFNAAATEILGYPRDKLMGMSFRDFTTGESTGAAEKHYAAFQKSGRQNDLKEYEITRGDGSRRLIEISASVIRDRDSRPAGFRGIIRDITEKKNAASELLIKSFAVEKSINAIAIMDAKGRCTFANNSFLMMWGCEGKDEVLGKSITEFCHPDNRDDFLNILEVLEEIGSWVGELSLKKKDDSVFFVILSAALIKNENEDTIGIIMSFVDITLRKKVDHSLKESTDILAKRTKLMEKDLRIAKTALDGIITQKIPVVTSVQADYRYYPMETLGGDFFCFYPYGDDALGVFICDISGHGVASSLFLTLLKSITDRLSMKFGDAPAEFVTQLNLELVGHMSSFYITGIYGLFSRKEKSKEMLFTYSNGAHPGPVLVKKNGMIKLHTAKSTLIGISNDITYGNTVIAMEREDRLFLYTDGIPETLNPQREMIGFEDGLLGLFKESHQLNLSENLDHIINQVSRFRNGAAINDDMLLMGFEAL